MTKTKVSKSTKPKTTKTKVAKPKVKAKAKAPTKTKAKVKATKATSTVTKASKRKATKEVDEVTIPDGTEVPTPPKAKLNSYTFFVAERRPKLSEKNPDWEFAVLTRKVADEWKALSDSKKAKYTKLAEKDAKRHVGEVEKWSEECRKMGYEPSDVKKYLREQKRRRKLPKGPKKPRTAYAFFMMEKHEELASEFEDFRDRTRKMASEWKKLSDTDKNEYSEKSVQDKKRYETALDKFLEENPEVAKIRKRKRKRKEGEPKRANTAYIFFTIENRPKVKSENPDMKTTEIMKELGKQWKALGDNKKGKYQEMAKKDTERYQGEKAAWLETQSSK